MPDKYTAVWVSHSSISDFLNCPRAYYLNHVYKDPKTGHKIQLVNASISLGQVVHQVLESLSVLPTKDRFKVSLIKKFEQEWQKVSGETGGFFDQATEERFKERGRKMLRRVMDNPGPVESLAVKIPGDLPFYWLSEKDNIILCGKIDWLEYLEAEDAVHIIDFKTGQKKVEDGSLQLAIYYLLVHNVQKRKVSKASYWYLETEDQPTEMPLPDLKTAEQEVLQVAKKIKLARQLEHFKCPNGDQGCFACRPLEKIIQGKAKKVGESDFKQDMYVILDEPQDQDNSVIL